MVEEKRFRIHIMKRNLSRIHLIAMVFYDTGRFISSCFSWESKVPPLVCCLCCTIGNTYLKLCIVHHSLHVQARSATAFFVFVLTVWNFELYMLPLTFLVIFGKFT